MKRTIPAVDVLREALRRPTAFEGLESKHDTSKSRLVELLPVIDSLLQEGLKWEAIRYRLAAGGLKISADYIYRVYKDARPPKGTPATRKTNSPASTKPRAAARPPKAAKRAICKDTAEPTAVNKSSIVPGPLFDIR